MVFSKSSRLTQDGLSLLRQGKLDAGIECLRQSLQLDPRQLEAALNAAVASHLLGDTLAGLTYLEAVNEFFPNHPDILNNQAVLLIDIHQLDAALVCLNQSVLLQPDSVSAHFNRANVLRALGDYAGSIIEYEQAIQLNPNDPEIYNNCGISLQALMACELALACFEQALALAPDYVDAWTNRGVALQDLMRLDEAMQSFEQALTLNSRDPKATWNKALLLILSGDYGLGWALHEVRWQRPDYPRMPDYPVPVWLGGEDIRGKRLLIYPEQGFGDFIQFCRYALVLAQQGVLVLLQVPQPLKRLLQGLIPLSGKLPGIEPGRVDLVDSNSRLEFDRHCPMMSLPYALKTQVNDIPARIPYLATPETVKQFWQHRLNPRTAFRVGLVWSGSPTHKNDHNRSIPLAQLGEWFSLPVAFYSLQKEIRVSDQAVADDLEKAGKLRIQTNDLEDFAETAGLIEQMDLVISVDTSVAHLAGALGKPVWVMLPYMPDHRWMLVRTDSPWYPTMTLFRQPEMGDWAGVIKEVSFRLMELASRIFPNS